MNDDSQSPPSDDLSWLALRYISGEMAEADSAAFEKRLGSEEAACEAVSVAVRTSLAVQVAFESETFDTSPSIQESLQPVAVNPLTTRVPARSARWLSLSVSALALFLVVSVANFRSHETASLDAERDLELAVLWTEAGRADEHGEVVLPAIVENESETASVLLSEDRLPPVDLVAGVPEWMLVALETQRGKAGDDDEILEN